MAGRAMAGLISASAAVSVGSLALAQVVSQPGMRAALFLLFLLGLFALLAAAVLLSDRWVQSVWASPERWPGWIQRRRFIRFVFRGVRSLLRAARTVIVAAARGVRAVALGVRAVARSARAAVVRLGRGITPETLRANLHALLDALGLPLEEHYETAPTGDRVTALEHALTSPRSAARHPRPEAVAVADPDPDVHTYLPASYRVTRDALEKACRGAQERNAALGTAAGNTKPADHEPGRAPGHISTTVRIVSYHPKADPPDPDRPQPDNGQLQRAFSTKRTRTAREAIRNAGHSALVAAMGILPDRGGSPSAR